MSQSVKLIPSVARLGQRSASLTRGTALAVATCRQQSWGECPGMLGWQTTLPWESTNLGRSSTHLESIVF